MGKEKYLKKIEALFDKSSVVDTKSIRRIIGTNSFYEKQVINKLLRQKKIIRLAKGKYTTRTNPELAVLAFQPGYLGLQDSLSQHGLWEQETVPVIVTSKKVRTGMRNIGGMNVLVRRTLNKYMFGIDYMPTGELYLPYSDVEKTLIDIVQFREKIGAETIKTIKKRIDLKKLAQYLKHYPNRTRKITERLLEAQRK